MNTEIIDLGNQAPPEPGQIHLIPIVISFAPQSTINEKTRQEQAVLAIDDNIRTYVYPVASDPYKNPVSFIQESILRGHDLYRDMLRRAYLEKKTICISPDTKVEWFDYDVLFNQCSFYVPRQSTAFVYEQPTAFVHKEWEKNHGNS